MTDTLEVRVVNRQYPTSDATILIQMDHGFAIRQISVTPEELEKLYAAIREYYDEST